MIPACDRESGIERIAEENPDIVILDIGLPEMDGFSALKELRLLYHLMWNAGRVATHDSLLATIWGTNRGRDSDRHTVAVHVLNLHSKSIS